jgi:hypothetical protein
MITMKKTLLPILMLGIAFSSFSVFAEQENGQGLGKGLEKKESLLRGEIKPEFKNYKQEEEGDDNGGSHKNELRPDISMPSAPEISKVESVTERAESFYSRSISRIQSRASALIRERINSLNANAQAISASKTLTTEQKLSLTTILSSNVTGLTALKASIASSTEASSTKALTESIFTNFRIYGIVIPQVRLEKRVFDLQNHSQKLSDLFVKVQSNIDEAKTKGRNVAVWQKSLDDAKVLVANDMAKLASLLPKLTTLTPATYGTTSKAIIDSVNLDLKNVAKDFNSISKTLRRPAYLPVGSTTPVTPPVVPPVTSTSTASTTPTVVSGSCGSTNGTTIASTPNANLCTSGVATSVAGSGPWTWSCTGSNGGTTSSCSASKTVTPPVATGYTTAQVAIHATRADCWITVSGKVYSVSNYISMHPGGSTAIVNVCGQDATTVFENRGGTGTHSGSARATLGSLLLGNLI